MTAPILPNPAARRHFLARHLLVDPPVGPATGAALAEVIDRLGFVQVDSIRTVERAHHMILWARRQSYRPAALVPLLERDRALFEHWTHDASILPVALFPIWKHRFARDAQRMEANWHKWFRPGYREVMADILTRIRDHGPVSSAEVGEGEARGKGGWWDWHPSKTALEWLWRTGELAITGRDNFRKLYDLTERVIPEAHRLPELTAQDAADRACDMALDRLGFGNVSEVAAFWNAVPADQARDWAARAVASGAAVQVRVECADGSLRPALARPDILTEPVPEPGSRLRILSPFDPALRDRNRAERLFGFFYRIEVFVPEAKRQYGYYVFPVLEGARLIGRIDVKADRDSDRLAVRAFWAEAGVKMTQGRLTRLESELDRMAAFAGVSDVTYAADWLRG
jgi:uncharacterized protein YcaQ